LPAYGRQPLCEDGIKGEGEESGPKNQKLGVYRNETGLFYFLAVILFSADSQSEEGN
jgi:hypothetical protein